MRNLGTTVFGIMCSLLTSCMLPYPSGEPLLAPRLRVGPVAPPYALPNDALVTFDDPTPGAASGVRASFGWTSNTLETYQIVFTLPGAFTFDGFTALGPAGTTIAYYAITTQGMTIPLRALTHDRAYADLYQDQTYDAGEDVLIEYQGAGSFRVTLPRGGDDQALSTTASFDAQATFQLLGGILRNPSTSGTYPLQATFTSVDPDNDGANDGAGSPPRTFDAERSITVACSTADQCDDGSACTTDTCTAGACVHDGGSALARLDCELAALAGPEVCAPDGVAPGFGRTVRKKVAIARAAAQKLEGASAKSGKRLVARMRRALDSIAKKARRSRKLSPACQTRFGTMVGARVELVNALPLP